MLDKIRSFNSLVDLLVLQEGYFHVPMSVLKNLLDDYYEIWRVVQSQNVKRITKKSFPIKDYDLDFSGTRFEFLNNLNPKPSIKVRYSNGGGSYFLETPSKKYKSEADYLKNKGFMQIDLSDPYRVVIDLIEHEVLHYIQYYIQKYTRIKKGEKEPMFLNPNKGSIGGLPSKKIIDDTYTLLGYSKGSKKIRKNIPHSMIPIEHYPDLLTAIRHMEFAFSEKNPDYEYDENNPTKWEKQKKQFFVDVLNGSIKVKLASSIFKNFKEISKQFYNHMVKVGYDAFVNKPPNFNARDLIKRGKEMESISPVTKKVQQNFNMLFNFYRDEMIYSDVYDFANDFLEKYFEITDGKSITGESVISNIGSLDVGESYSGRLPHKGKDVVAMFKRLKKYKDANSDIFTNVDRPTIFYNGEEEYFQKKHIQPAYKSLFENLKDHYYNNAIDDVSRENFKRWIDNFVF